MDTSSEAAGASRTSPRITSTRITACIHCPPGRELPPKLIESLARQSLLPAEYAILLLADRSSVTSRQTEAEIEAVANLTWSRDTLSTAAEIGAAALGLSEAPLIAFLDIDAVANPGWLAALCRSFDQFGEIARIVGGRVRPLWATPRPAWLGDELLSFLSLLDLSDEARFLRAGERIEAVNFAIRREAAVAIGAFPAALGSGPARFDMTALIQRIRQTGGRVVYDPFAAIDYLVPREHLSQSWFRRRAAWHAVGDLLSGPDMTAAPAVEKRWQSVKDYLFDCPLPDRTVRGLVLEEAEAGRFMRQVAAVGDSVHCLLSGLEERNDA